MLVISDAIVASDTFVALETLCFTLSDRLRGALGFLVLLRDREHGLLGELPVIVNRLYDAIWK